MKSKWPDIVSSTFVYLGMYYLLSTIWRELEIAIYGFSQESSVDSVVCNILCIIGTITLAIWRMIKGLTY